MVVFLRCVHWTDNGQKRQDWEGAIGAIHADFLSSFVEVSPWTLHQTVRSQEKCIDLRQLRILILIRHTVLVNDFKECVIRVLFAT